MTRPSRKFKFFCIAFALTEPNKTLFHVYAEKTLTEAGVGYLAAAGLNRFAFAARAGRIPVYPLPESDLKALASACAPLMALDQNTLQKMVPPRAGFWFSECPNCNQGAQEHQLVWTPALGDKPVLLPGLGDGILGTGAGPTQLQAHLALTGRIGHNHFDSLIDSLNLLLYGHGKELASDLGYSHSRARSWTMSTASHNTVVIDQCSQSQGAVPDRCQGRLHLFDGTDPDFQMVMGEAPTAYPSIAATYRRALIAVASGETQYVVDIFDVTGGKTHDWLLHGSADEEQTVEVTAAGGKALSLAALPTLLPEGRPFGEPKSENDSALGADDSRAFGLFRNPRSSASGETVVATFRRVENPRVGLQSWVLGVGGTIVTTASARAVRNIGKPTQEDDSKLEQRLRQAVLIQRQGLANRFVAIHCPFAGESGIKSVKQVPLEPEGVLLKIELGNGSIDYLLFGADTVSRTGLQGNLRFTFDGQAALVRVERGSHTLKRIGGTRLTFREDTLTGVRWLCVRFQRRGIPVHMKFTQSRVPCGALQRKDKGF